MAFALAKASAVAASRLVFAFSSFGDSVVSTMGTPLEKLAIYDG
jgi:hypothetical protein